MGEYIDRQSAIDAFSRLIKLNKDEKCLHWMSVIATLSSLEAADVVKVVRCRDCKHGTVHDENLVICHLYCDVDDNGELKGTALLCEPDGYCSSGEVKQ